MNTHFLVKKKLASNISYFIAPLILILSACGGGEEEAEKSLNTAPVVKAGEDQSVPESSEVGLSAIATDSDGSISSYSWSQTSGPSVVITNGTSANATFTAPEIADGLGNLAVSFNVTVTDDDGESANDTVSITIIDTIAGNNPPTVDAGQDQSVTEGSEVSLSATATDSDGSISSYSWSQISGPNASISGASQASASFTALQVDNDTQLTFQITVIDNNGTSNSDSMTVMIEDTSLGQPIVTVQRNGSDLIVSWNDTNAVQYRVLYWQDGNRPLEQLTTSDNLNLTNLSSGAYNVLVEAYDEMGHSVFSAPVQIGG